MQAAVYRGAGRVEVETIPVPEIGPGEILVRVETCGICHTDLKKIAYNLLEPPRIYGHETAGVVAAVGSDVRRFRPGDRVVVFHHIPCGECFYCRRKLFAQCPGLQEGRRDGGIRAGRRRLLAVRARHGLDRGARRRKNSGRREFRSGLLCRAGEHLPQGIQADRSAARRRGRDTGSGPHRPDLHHDGSADRRARHRYRYHDQPPRAGAEFRRGGGLQPAR